jgi:hypothetical protein
MSKDVLITPASGLIQFKDAGGNVDATIQLDDANVLNITGTISLGDLAANVYIGDGVNTVDIIFEQNGAVRALAGKTLTLGQANSNISFAGNITSGANITGNVTGGNLITGGLITATGNITGTNIRAIGGSFFGDGSGLTGISTTGGYFNSTLTAFPTGDYGNGEPFVEEGTVQDAFGVTIVPNFSCMDPQGSITPAVDLGAL